MVERWRDVFLGVTHSLGLKDQGPSKHAQDSLRPMLSTWEQVI